MKRKIYEFQTQYRGIIKIKAKNEADAIWKFLDSGKPSTRDVYGKWTLRKEK